MFSSGNRSKENNPNYPTQWALNPSAYQNVSSENVDWAALAQQWIMMKESVPPEHPPAGASNRKEILNEGGEAPMDVEKEDAEEQWSSNETSSTGVHDSWNWQQWGAWPGNWSGPPPAAGIVPQPANSTPMNKSALLPTPYTHFAPNTSDSNSAHSTDYQSNFSYDGAASSGGNEFSGNSSGYWTSSGNSGRGKHPLKPNRPHRKGFTPDIRPEPSTEPVTLDAAKRRQLPAWIREGLEKMEREKQKQLDREREKLEQEEILTRKKEEKEEALELLRSADGNILPPKSKFDSDSGDSGDENVNGSSSRSRQPASKSRRSVPSSRTSSPPLVLSEEERMAMVRRAMTEVLLQVTSSEIDTICQEEMNRFRSRTTASAKKGGRPAAPSAGPFAAGTLGLGIYGGGSSDSESENEKPGSSPAAEGSVHSDRRNPSSLNNSVHEDGLESNHQNKESVRKRSSDSQSKKIQESRDSGSSDSTIDDNKESGEQVDTTRHHGNGSSRSRSDRRRRSSSSNSNSSSSSSRTTSSETSKTKRSKKKNSPPKRSRGHSPRRHRRSSSSQSDDDSTSDSKSSDSRATSSRDANRRSQQSRRHRSRSTESEKRRSGPNGSGSSSTKRRRTECSRSGSSDSESRERRRTESSSSRNYRRERSTSRSRHTARSRRSRSRERTDRRRTRSRTRSRDRRDSYRPRRRSRSRTRSRSGGGKRTRGH